MNEEFIDLPPDNGSSFCVMIAAYMRVISVKGRANTITISNKPKGDLFEDCKEIDTIPGESEVSVSAFNRGNTTQSNMKTIKFNSSVRTEDPHLYILSVGIDRYKDKTVNLKYAVKDAKDIENMLKAQAATLYNPQNIHYALLIDEEATKQIIARPVSPLVGTF